jgi:hypothetical protein
MYEQYVEALSLDLVKYAMSKDMRDMISHYQQRIGLQLFDYQQYASILQQDQHNRHSLGVLDID